MANYLFRQLFSVQTWLRKGWDTLSNIIKTEADNAVCFLDQFQNKRVTIRERSVKVLFKVDTCQLCQRFLCFFKGQNWIIFFWTEVEFKKNQFVGLVVYISILYQSSRLIKFIHKLLIVRNVLKPQI